jgi:type III secretion protein R
MIPAATLAATAAAATGEAPGAFASHLGVTFALALLPVVVIAGTCFAKIAVVLNIARSAFGAPGVPPASVLTALAAVMSLFVMAPVTAEIAAALERLPPADGSVAAGGDRFGIAEARALYDTAAPPLIDFLERNTPPSEIDFFRSLSPEPAADSGRSLSLLLPAFAVAELIEAFWMGVLLLLPFLVIDLVVSNTLLGLGLHGLSPTTVSLPLKLLLFVAVDGWHLLVSGLVVSYG